MTPQTDGTCCDWSGVADYAAVPCPNPDCPTMAGFVVGAPPEGCHYCGVERRDHGQRWTAGVSWHAWVETTKVQIAARLRARLESRA